MLPKNTAAEQYKALQEDAKKEGETYEHEKAEYALDPSGKLEDEESRTPESEHDKWMGLGRKRS
jgi:hypothetical protein